MPIAYGIYRRRALERPADLSKALAGRSPRKCIRSHIPPPLRGAELHPRGRARQRRPSLTRASSWKEEFGEAGPPPSERARAGGAPVSRRGRRQSLQAKQRATSVIELTRLRDHRSVMGSSSPADRSYPPAEPVTLHDAANRALNHEQMHQYQRHCSLHDDRRSRNARRSLRSMSRYGCRARRAPRSLFAGG